jgi:hypothetical protein
MKRRILQGLLVLFILGGATCIGLHVYLRFFWDLGPLTIDWGLDRPHAIQDADPAAWARLRAGMTTSEVRELLGDSWSKVTPTSEGNCPGDSSRLAFWEYNWTDGLSVLGPSDRAYVVFFTPEGRVHSFRPPLTAPP